LASRFVRSARPDNAGKFAIGGLPAGVYGAVARDFIVDGQWEDPAFLNSLRDTATRVELTEGGMQTIALKLEPPR
jgi:hypothetical protein